MGAGGGCLFLFSSSERSNTVYCFVSMEKKKRLKNAYKAKHGYSQMFVILPLALNKLYYVHT